MAPKYSSCLFLQNRLPFCHPLETTKMCPRLVFHATNRIPPQVAQILSMAKNWLLGISLPNENEQGGFSEILPPKEDYHEYVYTAD